MPLQLLDLPFELLVKILIFLPPSFLPACQRVNRLFRATISESVICQYGIALDAGGYEDNPKSNLSVTERLDKLRRREEAWSILVPDFKDSIPLNHNASGIYDLTGGTYLLGTFDRRALHYITLPSLPSQTCEWSSVNVSSDVVDIGLSVHEHDLMVVVTT